jgi:hypothetical protein
MTLEDSNDTNMNEDVDAHVSNRSFDWLEGFKRKGLLPSFAYSLT